MMSRIASFILLHLLLRTVEGVGIDTHALDAADNLLSSQDRAQSLPLQSITETFSNVSSNVIINITSDVVLSLQVLLEDLENVMIIGHRATAPTVFCDSGSGVKFIACRNVTIV